jgi:UDP-N-acetyl-D-glucosamine dehydrogenase
MRDSSTNLHTLIQDREALVGVIGLGYVGLPLALAFADSGFKVLGFDIDQSKVDQLAAGESYIHYIEPARIAEAYRNGRLEATSDFRRLGEPDAILACVPTPLTDNREPDMSYVRSTTERIRDTLRRGQLIILESTTYPGTTRELLRSTLQETGLECGKDFFLAYSPEREDPGNASFGPTSIPKVVGGVDPVSGDLAEALYSQVVVNTIRVSSAEAAEASKLTENIFRAVNIALVNELKTVYDEMGIDIWEVLDAAETKPFGFMRFNPGPGWGGHCIPIDPFYLSWKARQYGTPTRFIEVAGEVNVEMPRRVISKLQMALNDAGKPVRGSQVLVLGLAYKKDVADPRESPAFEILWHLQQLGAAVSYHDPFIPQAPEMRSWKGLQVGQSVPLTAELLQQQDALVLVTDHTDVDYALVLENSRLIIDTRGVFRKPDSKVVPA